MSLRRRVGISVTRVMAWDLLFGFGVPGFEDTMVQVVYI